VTEDEWLGCTDFLRMLCYLGDRASDHKLRLLVVACCRQIWPLLTDERSRRAVEVGEGFADGKREEKELSTSKRHALAALTANLSTAGPRQAARAATCTVYSQGDPLWGPYDGIRSAAEAAAKTIPWRAARQVQMDLARDLFGPLLFRPVTVDPAWLSWGGGTIRKLAASIYNTRRFEDMPVLGDALEEAGCDNPEILSHCRGGGPHARGCWLLDLLLGKS
jgi:hypothetical protein